MLCGRTNPGENVCPRVAVSSLMWSRPKGMQPENARKCAPISGFVERQYGTHLHKRHEPGLHVYVDIRALCGWMGGFRFSGRSHRSLFSCVVIIDLPAICVRAHLHIDSGALLCSYVCVYVCEHERVQYISTSCTLRNSTSRSNISGCRHIPSDYCVV